MYRRGIQPFPNHCAGGFATGMREESCVITGLPPNDRNENEISDQTHHRICQSVAYTRRWRQILGISPDGDGNPQPDK